MSERLFVYGNALVHHENLGCLSVRESGHDKWDYRGVDAFVDYMAGVWANGQRIGRMCWRCGQDLIDGKPEPLTPRQAQAVSAIEGYQNKHGWAPTGKELGERLGIKDAQHLLVTLWTKHWIERKARSGRAVRVVG